MTVKLKKCLYCFVFALFVLGTNAQNISVDSARIAKLPDDTLKVKEWIELSEASLKVSFNRGKTFAESALLLAKEIGFNQGMHSSLMQIGRCESYLGNFNDAFENYSQACAYYQKSGNKVKQAFALNRMGETKRNLDEYEEALKYLQAALELNRELRDTNEMGSCYISIGILHAVQGTPKEAEPYFLKAIESFTAIGNEQRGNLTILNLASLYNEMKEYDRAIESGLLAREFFEKNGPEIRLGVCLFNLANSYEKKNDLQNARLYFLKSLEIFERLGDNYRANGTKVGLSRIDLKLGNTEAALKGALEGLEGAKEVGSLNLQYKAYDHLSNIYVAKKDFEKALQYRLLYQSLVDSVNSSETKERIAELEEKYQSEVKDRELKAAKADLELQELKVARQQVQTRILIGVVIAGVVIFLLLLIQYKTKQKTNEVLAEKNALIETSLAEKEVLLQEIHHRVKNNLQFLSSMFNLQARHVEDPIARDMLREGKNRIHSMALVHQKLYQEDNLKGVNMADYIPNLLDSLKHSYNVHVGEVSIETDVSSIRLDIDSAMPIGLILNELVTNCFKYAFPERESGLLKVSLKENEDNLELCVCDNGVGLAEQNLDSPAGFGIKLVKSLAEKLGGKVELKGEKGTQTIITITNYIKA